MAHATVKDLGQLYQDVIASFYALANALEKSGAVSKAHIAEAAQERLLLLRSAFPDEGEVPLYLLKTLATRFEQLPNDLGSGP